MKEVNPGDDMQWLLALEVDNDPISICRLMNVFRRKSVSLVTLSLAAAERGFSVTTLVDTPEAEVEHLYHFLRRSAGVEHVTCYLPVSAREPSRDDLSAEPGDSYIFINSRDRSLEPARASDCFPGCNVIFASQGKFLIEIPSEYLSAVSGSDLVTQSSHFVHLIRAKDTRIPVSELVA
jgi:hypothetical protein